MRIAFLDVRKAFDKAWRNGILYKLLQWNVSPFLRILYSSFSETFSVAKINGGLTRGFKQLVELGRVLFPRYCLIY